MSSASPGDGTARPSPARAGGFFRRRYTPLRRSCYFRTEFDVPGGVRSAVLRATARGFFEAYINGRRVGDALLQPGAIEKEQPYCGTDVTGLLLPGRNVLAAVTGNGWLNCSGWGLLSAHKPALLMELVVTDAEGRVRFVGTGEDWMAAPSPIIDNDLQLGERVDARLQIPGWNTASAGSAGWMPVKTLPGGFPGRPLVRDDCPPIRVTECRRPLSFREILPGVYLYDFGTNAAGRVRLNVRGARPGQTITIRHFERLDEHGAPHRGSYCDVFFPADSEPDGKAPYALKNTDVYICRGDAVERFESRFTYTGYRYATVEGYPGTPDPADVEGLVLHNDLPVTGALLTDSPQIESLWQAITRTYRSNIHSGPTDCPTREKNFWNGDIQAFADTACWYMDNSRFLARWTRAGRKITYGVYGWEDEEYIVPWTLYRFYGDTEILRVKYPVILRLIENRTAALTGPLPGGEAAPWRDHLAVENVPADFYAGCYYCLMLMRAAQIADVLGRGGDARDFRGRFETARAAFHERYYLPGEGDYAPRCQTGVVLPLAFGLTPEPCRARAAALLHDSVAERGYHPTTV